METWIILIISIAAAVILGLAVGVMTGKYMVKRANSNRKTLLSKNERIIYSACILLGTASILFGVFYPFPAAGGTGISQPDMPVFDGGMPNADPDVGGDIKLSEGEESPVTDEADGEENPAADEAETEDIPSSAEIIPAPAPEATPLSEMKISDSIAVASRA